MGEVDNIGEWRVGGKPEVNVDIEMKTGSLVFPGVSDYCIVNELYQYLDRSPS